MLDFNNKKNILRRLRIKGEKSWYWRILCSIAAVFVRIGYDVACAVSMIFSDKHGNLLGIKGLGNGERAERRMAEKVTERKARRQDDIVYVKKPIIGRFISAVLALSFVFMVVPELGIDLGLDFSAKAATVDATTWVEDGDGNRYLHNPDVTSDYLVFREDAYNSARANTIDSLTYMIGYGSIVINWTFSLPLDDYRGFYVEVVTAGGKVLNGNGNGEIIQKATTVTYTGLSTTDDVRVNVYPITYIDQWRYFAPEQEGLSATFDPYSAGRTAYMYEVRGVMAYSDYIKLDAHFELPDVRILTSTTDGAVTNSKRADIEGSNVITLTWDEAVQVGGHPDDDGVAKATGYRIYMSTDRGAFSYVQTVTGTTAEVTVPQGHYYQFFVEAYRYVWNPPTNASTWNTSHAGLISSSSGRETLSDDAKASSIYTTASNVRAHAYVAPQQPVMVVESDSDRTSYLISVTSDPANGTGYSGVYLFRTTEQQLYSSYIAAIDEGYDGNFGKWLVLNCSSKTTVSGIEVTPLGRHGVSGSSNTIKYSDRDIIAGVTYYYYAVAYLDKGDNTYLYSYGVEVQSTSLELTLGTPLWVSAQGTDGQIALRWEEVPNADGYELEIIKVDSFTNHDDDMTNNETVPRDIYVDPDALDVGNRLTYTHTRLYNDDQYRYRVRAYINVKAQQSQNDGELRTKYYSSWSTTYTVPVGEPIEIPQDLNYTTVDGKVTVTWAAVPGAKGYRLYYKKITEDEEINTKDKYFQDFEEYFDGLTKTTFTHTNLHNGDRYAYYVKAYKVIPGDGSHGNQIIESEPSGALSVRVGQELSIPQNIKTTTKDGEITVTWDPVTGAQGYILTVTNPDGSIDEYDVTKPPFNHVGLKNGDKYSYSVKAYKTVNGARDYSDSSFTVSQIVGDGLGIPQDFKATSKDGQITLSWSRVTGAEGYVLEFRTPEQGWDIYGLNGRTVDVSRTTFDHTRLNNGDVYEYRIRAYKTVNGDRVYSEYSVVISMTVGSVLDSPKDFTVVTTDGKATLSWSKVTGAEGYVVYAYSSGRAYQFDVSKTTYVHDGLANGDSWTYYVRAYKTVNSEKVYSDPTKSITVKIGISLNAVLDLKATAGNHQIDLTWKAVTGAEGYVVYLYNSKTMEFEPIAEVSGTKYSHIGLKNGTKYTYMVAPFKTTGGERFYGEYSIAVSAIPTTGSTSDVDRELNVKGTAPYGISHSEYMSAGANHDAFDESVDVYFTTNQESTKAVRDVLKNYANGLSSFVIYPFDISIYREGTKIEVDPADGYTVTITMPIPDVLIAYRDYLTVVHINDHDTTIGDDEIAGETIREVDWYDYGDQRLEVLPCAIVDIDNVWCVQFKCASFSPYALVIYKEHIQDVSAGFGIFDGSFAGTFNTGGLLLFTALPDIMPHNKKLRVVRGGSKRYRIKNIEKK